MNASIEARLNFLTASAYFYSTAAPTTSAHLMQEYHHLASENNITLKETESRRACKACGTISLPGWTSRTTITNPPKPKKFRSKPAKARIPPRTSPEKSKQVVTQCLVCRRSVNVSLKPLTNPSGIRPKKKNSERQAGSSLSESLIPESKVQDVSIQQGQGQSKSSENVNSKKRAKARKNGGLQAILDKSKKSHAASTALQLDLMDFMKLS